MPQGRIVLKSICQSRKLAALKTDGARLLYTWLLPNVDINGCFSGDEEVIKGQVFTRLKKSAKTIFTYLEDMESVGLIVWYQSNGDAFLQIPDFVDRQPSLNPSKEAKSTIPLPTPEQLRTYAGLTPPKVKESKEKVKLKESKSTYAEFVFLTSGEHTKLIDKLGDSLTASLIEELNDYVGSKGVRYKSHYHTILAWSRRKSKEGASKKTKLFPIAGKSCSECGMPAVYKDGSGAYDFHYCNRCMPDKVKELYE